ncbi:unnamed protein product [Amaranthus hypochondriacus]
MKTFTCLIAMVLIMTVMVDQSRGHSCDSTFFSSLVQLIPCRRAVSPFSPTLPSMACCNAVKALGQPCLCVLVKGPSVSGVDRGMTLQLPEKCSTNFDPCELTRK